MEELNYEIQFRKGSDNLVADYLSRSSSRYDWDVNNETEHFESKIYTINRANDITQHLSKEQAEDPVISKAMEQIRTNGRILSGQFKRYHQMKIDCGLLCRGPRIVVPKSCREDVLRAVHNSTHAGYGGIMKTYGTDFSGGGCF